MSYEIGDAYNLELPQELRNAFYYELCTLCGVEPYDMWLTTKGEVVQEDVVRILSVGIKLTDYKNTLAYQLANSSTERAKIAFEAEAHKESEQAILDLWLKYANQMTDFEKIMAGWSKLS